MGEASHGQTHWDFCFMIVRRYESGEGDSLEYWITPEKTICFKIEDEAGSTSSIELTYEDVDDLRDRLYDFLRKIEPPKPN
jgi:hypothetical protein